MAQLCPLHLSRNGSHERASFHIFPPCWQRGHAQLTREKTELFLDFAGKNEFNLRENGVQILEEVVFAV